MDETRIDAGPTPAHVFAYRAFRSVFVRSPESSPLQARDVFDERNKENMEQSPLRGSRFTTSPVKSKRKDGEIDIGNLAINLTPKRQKTIPVSPTKSILKKSHALTPRRAELRDVTVTFKDVRKSVSPEMTRRSSPTRVRSQPELGSLATQKFADEFVPRLSKPTLNINFETIPMPTATATRLSVPSKQTSSLNLDAYVAQTEKEMRRLIKYGQKWKEQARRQEDENVKLRSQLETAQKESKRLQDIIRKQEKPSVIIEESDSPTPKSADQGTQIAVPHVGTHGSYRSEPQSHPERSERHQIPERTISLRAKLDELQKIESIDSSMDYRSETNSHKNSSTNEQQKLHEITTGRDSSNDPQDDDSITGVKLNTFRNAIPAVKQRISSDSGVLRMPQSSPSDEVEDRRAAARERLRLKREARAVSMPLASVPEAHTAKTRASGLNSSRVEIEDSQVDWLAMA